MLIRRTLWFILGLWVACGVSAQFASSQTPSEQSFSDWIQASGFGQIKYRWKPNDQRGCDVEYKNFDDHRNRKYKTRIVFQASGDEHHLENAVLSFGDGSPVSADHIAICNAITDITVTHF